MKAIRFTTALLAAIVVMVPLAARAQDTAASRNQLIAGQCQSVKNALASLQRRDLVSRTNLGREYESTAKELAAFGQRVHNNGLSATAYDQLLDQFNDTTSQFREDYVHYDDALNALQQINCQTKPAEFDTQLANTRALRDATEGATSRAAAVVGQYRDTAAQLQIQLTAEGRTQ